MCKFADRLTHFSMYGSTTAIQKLFTRQTQVIEGKPKHDGGKDRRTRVKHNAKLVN
jgi:hypothetical protein